MQNHFSIVINSTHLTQFKFKKDERKAICNLFVNFSLFPENEKGKIFDVKGKNCKIN